MIGFEGAQSAERHDFARAFSGYFEVAEVPPRGLMWFACFQKWRYGMACMCSQSLRDLPRTATFVKSLETGVAGKAVDGTEGSYDEDLEVHGRILK